MKYLNPDGQNTHRFSRPVSALVVMAILLIAAKTTFPAHAQKPQAQLPSDNDAVNVLELFVDMSLGLVDQSEFKTAGKRVIEQHGSMKEAIQNAIEHLDDNLLVVRQVSAAQFATLMNSMEMISSGQSIEPIGLTTDMAYLEASVFLTSQQRCRAIIATAVKEMGNADRDKFIRLIRTKDAK